MVIDFRATLIRTPVLLYIYAIIQSAISAAAEHSISHADTGEKLEVIFQKC